ncbi:hypothetical protein [Piscinibacter terrae]|uniref:Uncharacterized protein n=1 Tax=Piscinibacter terrae TaxID=2496871 RepID=A0A3N7HHG1_9BURK|nr:hypothetical protein [Albitalea terrae]RQP21484.1 hypothetical protein DZC73_26550 [Albitalea terrae]
MKILRGIDQPFGGEHVLVTVPALGPYAKASADEPALRKRLNLFPQRSLTHTALIDEQRGRIADAMRLGQSVAPGVIDGLELAIEGNTLVLLPGHAISPDGQDIELAYPLHVAFDAISVISPRVEKELEAAHVGATPWQRLSSFQRQASLKQVLTDLGGASFLPHAMVLVAVPRTIALDRSGEDDSPCPNATEETAFSRAAWEDGFQLVWSPWPDDRPLPLWSTDGTTIDARFRNRLAYAVFNAERERLSISQPRSMREWMDRAGMSQAELDAIAAQAALLADRGKPWPWEQLGVPLSIVAFDAGFKPVFADRAAVVRQGGGRHNRSALVPWSGDDVLWQARVSQLLEHLAEMPQDQRTAAVLAQQFDWLPPAGVLPRDAADFVAGRQGFFPPTFDVQAQPIPVDMVDALIAEASPLLPFNLSLRDQVQLLVPVPSRFYDPELLQLDVHINPLFDLEVDRLTGERLKLLTRRDALRRRYDLLTQAMVGDTPSYPQDDANALPDETGALDALAFARIHRSNAVANSAQIHGFTAANLKLEFQAVDELIVFVRIDSAPAGIGVRALISADPPQEARIVQPFTWGDVPADADGDRIGDLPQTGVWTKLSVPMSRAGLAGQKIDGLAFAIFGGAQPSQVSWGYAGKAASGIESYWVTDALPPGAQVIDASTWVWVDQGDPADASEDAAFGVPVEAPPSSASTSADATGVARPHTRHVSELDKLLSSWKNFRGGILTVELGEPAGLRNATTPPRTIDGGLDELIQRLDGRIKAAGDHVDFGFLRARTDIFRIRQSVLGTDDAGRFLTSPAAAELVQRNDNPVATEKEFSDYFKQLNAKAVTPPDFNSPATPRSRSRGPAPRAGVSSLGATRLTGTTSRVSLPTSTFALSSSSSSLFTSVAAAPQAAIPIASVAAAAPSVIIAAAPTAAIGARPGLEVEGAVKITPEVAATPVKIIGATARTGLGVSAVAALRPAQLSVEAPPAIKDVVGASLIGATYNTVTVAERFTLPASVVSSNTAAKGKNDFVVTGINGLKASGLVVDDLPIFGYKKASGDNPTTVTAGDLLGGVDMSDEDAADVGSDLHEAVYFRRGIDAIDNTIRFLRGMELRGEDYRRLQADAKAARERISGVTAKIQDLLASLALKLAEVRHDLSVARALRDEEQARIDALITKRKTILAEQVPYLVFRRPRFTLTLQDVPLLDAQPADVSDPVPRCRNDAHDAPPELMAMVDTLRDVPVHWLKPISQVFVKLDRITDIERVVAQAQQRVFLGKAVQTVSALGVTEGAHTGTGQMLNYTFERHAERITKTYQDAAQQLVAFDASSWRQAIEPVQRIANVRDLLQVGTQQREVTLAASGLLDDIAGVASCLHASFCNVPPATRLRWAELFSQLDATVSLRVLTVLPGFGNESLGVDYIAWRQMQRMVDWLFAQVADEAPAQEAINDLVRVCMLLAAHAPVKRIISARIRRPVPSVVNTRLDIDIDPKVTRIGMQVLVHSPATQALLARAVVEDLADGVATARITHAPGGPSVMLDASMRVQVQAGPPLTTATVQRAEAAKVQADAVPRNPGAMAARPAQQAADPVAEKRVAKQVDALRMVRMR